VLGAQSLKEVDICTHLGAQISEGFDDMCLLPSDAVVPPEGQAPLPTALLQMSMFLAWELTPFNLIPTCLPASLTFWEHLW
jgi:hypothetical protein